VTLRPFNTYGPRQSARAIIPTIISQLLSDRSEIKLGDLTPVRDLNFVKDTVSAYLAVASAEACIGGTFNAGSGRAVTIGELAETLMKLTGRRKKIVTDQDRIRPAKSEVFKLIATSEALQKAASWGPQWTLEKGLMETIDFIQANISRFQGDQYVV
jgi:nucleoside-diphosphate-sugar epimerase